MASTFAYEQALTTIEVPSDGSPSSVIESLGASKSDLVVSWRAEVEIRELAIDGTAELTIRSFPCALSIVAERPADSEDDDTLLAEDPLPVSISALGAGGFALDVSAACAFQSRLYSEEATDVDVVVTLTNISGVAIRLRALAVGWDED